MVEVREKMEQYRKDNDISLKTMSRTTGVSSGLLALIEGGYVTHPDIAKKIQKGYKLSDEEVEKLMPEIHRKSSDKYEPNKFKIEIDKTSPIVIPYHDPSELELYISDHNPNKKEK